MPVPANCFITQENNFGPNPNHTGDQTSTKRSISHSTISVSSSLMPCSVAFAAAMKYSLNTPQNILDDLVLCISVWNSMNTVMAGFLIENMLTDKIWMADEGVTRNKVCLTIVHDPY